MHRVQHLENLASRLRALRRTFLQTAPDQIGDVRRDFRCHRFYRSRHLGEMRGEQRLRILSEEGGMTCEQLVGDAAEGIKIRAMVCRWIARRLFGSYVCRSANDGPG